MPFKIRSQEWLSKYLCLEDISGGSYIECVDVLWGLQHLTEMCSKNLWNLICIALHTKCGVTCSYLVVYYPCCGDVDINQLETYRLKLDGGFCENTFLARRLW